MLSIVFRIYSGHWCVSAIMFRKKFLAIPLVAASETGIAQTMCIYIYGVVGRNQHLVAQSHQIDI